MSTFLLAIDIQLFLWINYLPHNPFTDSFFALLSGVGAYGLIWVVFAIFLIVIKEIPDKRTFFQLCFAIFLTLIIVNSLKVFIERPRPEFVLPEVIVVADTTESYAFPSAHAAVAFAAASVLSRKHQKFAWWYYMLAVLIAFSRIYLGKHYPSDVLGGMILGLFIGLGARKMKHL